MDNSNVTRYVTYCRVSTKAQGESGLGLEAQRKEVEDFLATKPAGSAQVVSEYVEVESGTHNDRPELQKALNECKLYGATLLVAKLDRLSRSAAFLTALQESGTKFVCADFPEADHFLIGVMALIARWEADKISSRTRAALKAKKARGEPHRGRKAKKGDKLPSQAHANSLASRKAAVADRAEHYRALFAELDELGIASHRQKSLELTRRGVPTPSGTSTSWSPIQVSRIAKRLEEATQANPLL